jgi:thiol:disulfide interchange protein
MQHALLSCLVFCLAVSLSAQMPYAVAKAAQTAAKPTLFDPTRDAAKDIEKALTEAERTGKRVILDVGGDWCRWCHEMERYIEAHAELRELRDRNFVTVKVNWSPENRNEAVLSKYPKIKGYPHLFVLDAKGALLHSQDTGLLEDGKSSYDLEKFTAFLKEWSPS